MFLMIGIGPGEKQLAFGQAVVCPRCGRYGRIQVFVTYQCFSLFFIPLFQWGKRYEARMSCCGAACELPAQLGERIAQGEAVDLCAQGLFGAPPAGRRCATCGYEAAADFSFCPKCGRSLC